MTLGYCTVCQRLVAIVAKELKSEASRERRWYPVEHDDEKGRPCLGVRKGI